MKSTARFAAARRRFHDRLKQEVLKIDSKGVPTNADKDSPYSVQVASGIAERIGDVPSIAERRPGQTSGTRFENITRQFLQDTFSLLDHVRPGEWEIRKASRQGIAEFEQYAHLIDLEAAAKADAALAAALGSDYTIKPDVVILRHPEPDSRINESTALVSSDVSNLSSLRRSNNPKALLHASISCKWTIRSDRSQNARAEGLNLIRNRKGRVPHIAVVTAEPTPGRISSIAIGTGDIDCVYHFALYELQDTLRELDYPDAREMLAILVEGKRLRDISDLPLDLVV